MQARRVTSTTVFAFAAFLFVSALPLMNGGPILRAIAGRQAESAPSVLLAGFGVWLVERAAARYGWRRPEMLWHFLIGAFFVGVALYTLLDIATEPVNPFLAIAHPMTQEDYWLGSIAYILPVILIIAIALKTRRDHRLPVPSPDPSPDRVILRTPLPAVANTEASAQPPSSSWGDVLWQQRRVIGFTVLLLLLLFFARGRYAYVNAGAGRLYRVDRWTGEVFYIDKDRMRPVEPDYR